MNPTDQTNGKVTLTTQIPNGRYWFHIKYQTAKVTIPKKYAFVVDCVHQKLEKYTADVDVGQGTSLVLIPNMAVYYDVTDPACTVGTWHISLIYRVVPVASTDPIYTQFNQPNSGPLTMNTETAIGCFLFSIKVSVTGPVIGSDKASINGNVCLVCKVYQTTPQIGLTNLVSFSKTATKIALARPATLQQMQVNPLDFHTVDHTTWNCQNTQVAAFKDAAKSQPTVAGTGTWQLLQTAAKVAGVYGTSNHIAFNIGPATTSIDPVHLSYLTLGFDTSGNQLALSHAFEFHVCSEQPAAVAST